MAMMKVCDRCRKPVHPIDDKAAYSEGGISIEIKATYFGVDGSNKPTKADLCNRCKAQIILGEKLQVSREV